MKNSTIFIGLFFVMMLMYSVPYVVGLLFVFSDTCKSTTFSWHGQYVYDADVVAENEDLLNEMLGDTWTVLAVEERFHAGFSCDCGLRGRNPHTYLVTFIEFLDANGNKRSFHFYNHELGSPFLLQVERMVHLVVAEHFQEFIDSYFQDIPLGGLTGVRGRRNGVPGTVRLHELNPANAFVEIPMYLSITVQPIPEGDHTKEFDELIFGQMERMIASMNAYTNYTLTANFRIFTVRNRQFYDRESRRLWEFVQGELYIPD
jgi:hypothetical protein